jgi:hypothetical protein
MRRQTEPHWDVEPQLALRAAIPSESRAWLAQVAHAPAPLDVRRWQRRAARGITWNRNGIDAERRGTH